MEKKLPTLVDRPAKQGEWIQIMRCDITEIYQEGDILQVIEESPFPGDVYVTTTKPSRYYAEGIKQPFSYVERKEYQVLENYMQEED